MNVKVSVIFAKPQDFVAFYHQGLTEFCRNLPMPQISPPLETTAPIPDEPETEAKMLVVIDVAEERLADFEEVTQFFGGQIISSDQLDAMGI
jgi:hypothetical protein